MEFGDRTSPLVSVEFALGESVTRVIDVSPSAESSGSVHDPNSISEEAAASNTSFLYSGRHDHGNLPSMRSTGYYSELIWALQESKRRFDDGIQSLDTAGRGSNDVTQGPVEDHDAVDHDAVDHDAVDQEEAPPAPKRPRSSS